MALGLARTAFFAHPVNSTCRRDGQFTLAIETARESGCPADIIVGRLSEDTADHLGIHFGQAKRL